MNISVQRYEAALAADWARVIANAKNSIFLFERGFVEYHGDRFFDFSAVAYVDGKAAAVIPAAITPATGEVVSHPGLTFGGIVLERTVRSEVAFSVIDSIVESFRSWGAKSLTVKLLPQIFASYPAAELDYALWRRGFSLVRRDLSSALPLERPLPMNTLKKRAINKARKAGLVTDRASIGEFHELLRSVLLEQHGVEPVHTAAELELLVERFPSRIFVRAVRVENRLAAGALVFNYGAIWHTQYLAASDVGRKYGALDLVISDVIDEATAAGAKHLSFGTSTVEAGTVINEGLLWQKESFGARAIVHDFMRANL